MKKLSLYIFLSFLWCNVGVAECIKIQKPDLSSLNWTLVDETIYENINLGIGLRYENYLGKSNLNYYSYNGGHTKIDETILEKELHNAVDMAHKAFSMKDTYISNSDWRLVPEKIIQLTEGFLYNGVWSIVTHKFLTGSWKSFTAIALGANNNCIHKIRYTAALNAELTDPEAQIHEAMENLFKIIIEIKLNK